MIKVITNENKRVASWAEKHMEDAGWHNPQCFGFEKDGELVGAIIFTDWSKNDIHVHVASTDKSWWQRRYLSLLFDYTWGTCGCVRVSSVARVSNEKAQKLNRTMGFKEEGRVRSYFPKEDGTSEDGILFGLLKDEDTPRWYKTQKRET
jgi:RimJ/RimL family protein N-acetyltransferase